MADLKPGDVVSVANDERFPAWLRGERAVVVRVLRTRVEVKRLGEVRAIPMTLVKKVPHE